MVTEKNEKRQTTVCIPETQGVFSDKISPDIDDFTDEQEFQCDNQVVKNTFIDDSK